MTSARSMAASQPGGLPRQGHVPNGVGSFRRDGADRPPPGAPADTDVDAANILEAWDRARAAEDASVHRGGVLHEQAPGPDGAAGAPGVPLHSGCTQFFQCSKLALWLDGLQALERTRTGSGSCESMVLGLRT